MSASIEIIIEICTYGLLNSYKCEAGIEYIGNHLSDIIKIDRDYKYEDLRIISLIKANLWGDFTIFSIYYLSRIDKDKIKALFDCLCKTHESLSSANGRVKIKEEKLILDENITSLSDMVNFQLNI